MAHKNDYFDTESRNARLRAMEMDNFWKNVFHLKMHAAIKGASEEILWKVLNEIPEDTEVETVPPVGRFWVFGPSTANGFCVVVQSGPGGVTFPDGYHLYRYEDLMRYDLKTIRAVQEVVFQP